MIEIIKIIVSGAAVAVICIAGFLIAWMGVNNRDRY